eukprot:g22735.t1
MLHGETHNRMGRAACIFYTAKAVDFSLKKARNFEPYRVRPILDAYSHVEPYPEMWTTSRLNEHCKIGRDTLNINIRILKS